MILTIGIVCACLLLAALIDTADRNGNRQSALLQCSTLNVLLWVLLAFWFGAARRSGWPGVWTWGPLMFAWATVATLALFWWLLISTRGPVVAAPTHEPPTLDEIAAAKDPPGHVTKINGRYPAQIEIDEEMLRERYRRRV